MKKIGVFLLFLLPLSGIFAQSSLVIQVNGGINKWSTTRLEDVDDALNANLEELPTAPTQFGLDALFRPIKYLNLGLGYRYFLGNGPRNELNFKIGPTIPIGIIEINPLIDIGAADGIQSGKMHISFGAEADVAVRLGNFGIHARPGLRVFREDLPYALLDPQLNTSTVQTLESNIVLVSIEAGISLKLNLSGDEN